MLNADKLTEHTGNKQQDLIILVLDSPSHIKMCWCLLASLLTERAAPVLITTKGSGSARDKNTHLLRDEPLQNVPDRRTDRKLQDRTPETRTHNKHLHLVFFAVTLERMRRLRVLIVRGC